MSSTENIDISALEHTLNEYLTQGRAAFLAQHEFEPARRYFLEYEGALFDAKAVINVAYRYQYGHLANEVIRGGEKHSNRLIRNLGLRIVDGRPTTVEGELAWRLAIWKHLQTVENPSQVSPQILRDFGAYGGGQGIWVDSSRTSAICSGGITVGVLHTGIHYPDHMGDESALYYYPNTERRGDRDASEIFATKRAARLKLPIFIIAKPTRNATARAVRLAWVEGWADETEQFLINYHAAAPESILDRDTSDNEPFQLTGNRRRRVERAIHVRPEQARFKLQIIQRYGSRCPLTGIEVPQMIEAAHLRPVPDNGSNDPRNGIPLSASLHRAFDANLFAFHPDTLEVVTRPGGPTPADMRLTQPHIRDLPKLPHRDALTWRFDRWAEHARFER
jgi:putative restriction endonuclease